MKRLFVVALLASASACAPASKPATPAVTGRDVTVLVFNIHAGKDASGKDNLTGVAALARDVKADLVLLQEVDRGTKRSGNVDQVKVMGDASTYGVAFGRSLDYDGGQYGIAALSRAGFDAQFTEALPVTPAQTRSFASSQTAASKQLQSSPGFRILPSRRDRRSLTRSRRP